MILTCPECSTRYQADEAKFPAQGRVVRCAKCGHSWHQPGPEPEAATPEFTVDDAAPVSDIPSGDEPVSTTSSVRAYAPAAQVPPPPPRGRLLQKLGIVAGWAGLIAVVLLIGVAAVRYRQEIAAIWPQSAGLYSGLGLAVNANGIDFKDVVYKRQSEDGQAVLAVTGTIVNVGARELPVPQKVRVTLSDAENRELYHWSFTPDAQTLKAGQSIPFRTRITSPPSAARHLEVRFAPD